MKVLVILLSLIFTWSTVSASVPCLDHVVAKKAPSCHSQAEHSQKECPKCESGICLLDLQISQQDQNLLSFKELKQFKDIYIVYLSQQTRNLKKVLSLFYSPPVLFTNVKSWQSFSQVFLN